MRVQQLFVDRGESAKTADRTEFHRLLQYCRENSHRVHCVVVYAVNRFSRSMHDHAVGPALLSKLGITLRSLTEPINDLFENRLDEGTYERQKPKLDEEVALAEIAAHDARLEELDVDGLLGFAEHLLTSAGRLWMGLPLDQRQRLQKILFPKGLSYGDGGFEPAETSVILRMLQTIEAGKSHEATLTTPSWNQLVRWLRELDLVRSEVAA